VAGASDYTENKIVELLVGKTAFTLPTAHIALYTVAPDDAGGGTEVSGGAYARRATTGGNWSSASGGALVNAIEFAFPQSTAAWGLLVAFSLFDAPTGGNMLGWNLLPIPVQVNLGDTPKFAAGDLNVTCD
jgi:hypothetical protein